MTKIYYQIALKCLIILAAGICEAQPRVDSTKLNETEKKAVDIFFSGIADQSRLYNGPEYTFYDPLIKGNAYYNEAPKFEPGAVMYDGVLYSDVPLLYDLNKDCLAVLLLNKTNMIRLIDQRVAYFDLLGHHFKRIDLNNDKSIITPGFYDVIYGSDKLEILAKRRKEILTKSTLASTFESYFNPQINYFIKLNGIYKSINSKSALLSVFKDRKKDLEQYIKSNNLNFDDSQKERSMVQVAAYYDQLTN
ncbi:hypothetical protein ACFQZX_16220 [Mucilaginibacter litoreus]|uniref:DKNYY family protein n=1 Tax=Mucilaginibacter litoreus TaxID=1048221 RepID=A0ABW3AXV7_9SPHI